MVNISPITGELDPSPDVGNERHVGFRKDLRMLTNKVGIPYRPPHQLRHSVINYSRKLTENTTELEAVAHNALQSLSTMLKYGKLDPTASSSVIDNMINRSRKSPQLAEEDMTELLRLVKNINEHVTGNK